MQLWDGIQSPLEGSVPATGAGSVANGTISNPRPRIIVIGATNRPQVCVCVCVCVCACMYMCMHDCEYSFFCIILNHQLLSRYSYFLYLCV